MRSCTSLAENPGATSRSITVSEAGTYSCAVTCPCGSLSTPSLTLTSLSAPSAPTGTGSSRLGPGALVLSASGNDLHWFDAQSGGSEVGAGNSFNTPMLQSTTDYWVEARNTFSGQQITVGKVANTTQGAYLSDKQWLFFDAALKGQGSDKRGLATHVATTSERILEVMDSVTGMYEKAPK